MSEESGSYDFSHTMPPRRWGERTVTYVERPVTWPENYDNKAIELAMVGALRGQKANPQVRSLLQLASDLLVDWQSELAMPENAGRPGVLARAAGGMTALGEFIAAAQSIIEPSDREPHAVEGGAG